MQTQNLHEKGPWPGEVTLRETWGEPEVLNEQCANGAMACTISMLHYVMAFDKWAFVDLHNCHFLRYGLVDDRTWHLPIDLFIIPA
jgi:hypothetical protein